MSRDRERAEKWFYESPYLSLPQSLPMVVASRERLDSLAALLAVSYREGFEQARERAALAIETALEMSARRVRALEPKEDA